VKRSRFTLRSSQSQNELKRLQTKLRRLKEELQRLQKAQQTFVINVKDSLEKIRASQEEERNDSREEIKNTQEENVISQEKNAISQKLTKQKELRVLREFLQKEDLELSQFSQEQRIREHELNLDSRKDNFISQLNNVFVKKNSQQERISSRLIYRVAYISK
jgi:uncharacterized protein YllA (UPF0747 family)